MSRKIVTVLGVLAILAALGTGVYYQAPELVREPLLELNRSTAGLEEKVVQVGDHRVHYLEGGRGETLVLLHGIFAEKDHWVDFARMLTDRYHVIAPDLPGFGESTRLLQGDYTYPVQVERLRAFLQQLNLEAVHLAGNSMGGTLAALYAVAYPDATQSLAFIGAPHGIRSSRPSEMDLLVDAQKTPLVVHNPEEFEAMLNLVFVERPLIPYPLYVYSQTSAISRAVDNERIFKAQHQYRYLLESQLPLIKTPTLALWGEGDRIFDVSGAEVLRQAVSGSKVTAMAGVGHLPQMEVPKLSAEAYAQFLAGGL